MIKTSIAAALALALAAGTAMAEFKDFTVNGELVTKAQQEAVATEVLANSGNPHQAMMDSSIEEQVKDMIIETKVMGRYARQQGLDKDPAVQEQIARATDMILMQHVLICCGVMRLSLRRTLAENSSASQVYDAIRIIGDKTRFDILCYLRDHPAVYGQQLCNHFGLARNTIHHQMSKLVNAGLVTCLVEGNRIYYTTDREHLSYLLNQQRQLLIGGEDVEILIIDDGSTKDRIRR